MKIYRIRSLEVAAVNAVDPRSTQLLFRSMDGRPYRSTWQPPQVELITADEDGRPLQPTDVPRAAGAPPILRRDALDRLRDLPGEFEALPLECDEADLVVLNVTRVLTGAVDLAQSKVRRIRSKILMVDRPAFRRSVIEDVPIFKIAEVATGRVYFNQTWADALTSLNNVAVRTEWDSQA